MVTREVLISRLFILLLYLLQNIGRSESSGKVPQTPFAHSTRVVALPIPDSLPTLAIFLLANVRFSNSAQSSPSEYNCLHPNCGHISSRAHDLKRHMTVHFPPAADELLDCKYEWCGRTGSHGFKREDHRKEHYRNVHMKASEYPKTGKGGRSSRNSGRSRP